MRAARTPRRRRPRGRIRVARRRRQQRSWSGHGLGGVGTGIAGGAPPRSRLRLVERLRRLLERRRLHLLGRRRVDRLGELAARTLLHGWGVGRRLGRPTVRDAEAVPGGRLVLPRPVTVLVGPRVGHGVYLTAPGAAAP